MRSRKKGTFLEKEFLDLSEAVEAVLHSPSAFLTLDSFFPTFATQVNHTEREYCKKIQTLKALNSIRWAGMYVRRNWKYKEHFGQK